MSKKGVYCLEGLWNPGNVTETLSVKPILELLNKAKICDHFHHLCATKQEFELYLNSWANNKTLQNKYPILYFAFHVAKGFTLR